MTTFLRRISRSERTGREPSALAGLDSIDPPTAAAPSTAASRTALVIRLSQYPGVIFFPGTQRTAREIIVNDGFGPLGVIVAETSASAIVGEAWRKTDAFVVASVTRKSTKAKLPEVTVSS
jgi:hypothetical protein